MKILVVDDDSYILKLTSFMLKDKNYKVECRNSVEEGISCLNESKFDLLISDLVMPPNDGLTLIRYAKEHNPDMPVIAITGGLENSAEDYKNMADLFADMTLEKPVKKDELVKAIIELTGQG